MKSFLKFFSQSFKEGTEIGILSVFFAILIGSGAHFTFYFIFKYWFHLYENPIVRGSAVLLSIFLGLIYRKRDSFSEKYLVFYWHLMLIFILPFVFTFNLLANNFNELWLYWELFMIFVLILYVPNWFAFLVDLSLGVLYAAILYSVLFGSFANLDFKHFNPIWYSIVVIFSAITGLFFAYATRITSFNLQKKQFQQMMSLAGSIAHEMRNPISSIRLSASTLPDFEDTQKTEITAEDIELIKKHKELLSKTINLSNEIIDMTLHQLSDKKLDHKDFVFLSSQELILDTLLVYGYKSNDEKDKIRINFDGKILPIKGVENFDLKAKSNFMLIGIDAVIKYIIFNLLKNALYYLKQYPNSIVTVGCENRVIDGVSWNVIYVLDTGPGISKDNISKLFGDFYTSGKKEGTGLGLAFCKRNMKAFGGDIICESELGKWTKFSLLFPALSDEDLEKARLQILQKSSQEDNQDVKNTKAVSAESKTKILIVDDEKTNLLVTKSKIERNLQISCDLAHDGAEAVELVSRDIHKYHLVLMDIQMPEMNGVMAAQKIRAMNKNIPIIALTSLEYEDFENANLDNFNYYLNKPVAGHVLYRTINKFMPDTKDGLEYLGGQDQYLGELKGKKVLLADDQELNLKISSRKLTSVGMEIVEARDGKELLGIYKNSLSEGANNQLKSKFDLIITDINMPIMSGDEVISAIRKIERDSKISFKNRIPAIALTGDGDWDHINSFFKLGIDDYFVKGADSEKLIRTAALYLSPQKIYFNKHHLEQHKKMAQLQEGALQILNIEKMRYFNENDRKEFLKVFLEESALEIANIRNLQNSDKKVELSKSLHALKGICGNIGAEIIFSLIKELEKDLKDENLKNGWCEGLLSKYDDLEREIKKLFA